jgi:hypothetical protein
MLSRRAARVAEFGDVVFKTPSRYAIGVVGTISERGNFNIFFASLLHTERLKQLMIFVVSRLKKISQMLSRGSFFKHYKM